MTIEQKASIIEKAKEFFSTIIIPKHIANLNNLKLKDFDINPFLINYLAAFLCGDTSPLSIAKALVYPHVLGTSINTSFGQNTQIFISSLSEIIGNASGIDGIDIEFIDALDGRRKYCQCKTGPNSINTSDIVTILGNFKKIIGKTSLDKLPFMIDDMIVGVLYGDKLSADYKIIEAQYPVYYGSTFWHHLTGDENFYYRLAKAFGEVVEDERIDGKELILTKVKEIADEIIAKREF
ncbi:MAG: restriction endonuclease [Pseudoflavonifractor sp.]|nr:restriction endonuclease [Alloprevotella sp.]MCM1117118.1 restriction endonuclease [Pseudoflavonifractor sp.]